MGARFGEGFEDRVRERERRNVGSVCVFVIVGGETGIVDVSVDVVVGRRSRKACS